MTQLGLDWTPKRASVEALEALPLKRVRDDHRRILAVLAGGPMSDVQLLAATGCHPNAIRARRGELVEAGLVQLVTKEVQNGRKVCLWGLK